MQVIYQGPDEYVGTFDNAYHCGFNLTPSVAEAKNFCPKIPELSNYRPCNESCARFRQCLPIILQLLPATQNPRTTKNRRQLSIGAVTPEQEVKRAKYCSGPGIPIRDEDQTCFGSDTETMVWTHDILDPLKLGGGLKIDHDNKCELCGQVQESGKCCLDELPEPKLEIRYIDPTIRWGVVALSVRASDSN